MSYSSDRGAGSRRKLRDLQALSGRFLRLQVTSVMNSKSPPTEAAAREARLKAALKANLGRRKAQARAKATKQVDEKSAQEKE